MSNKMTWQRVKFGDVVRQVKDKVDPQTSGLERYIAGGDMDTDDLRIRRWGTIDDGYLGPAFHMRFKPGQVLYGSRRTYLRKVALADFEGICANTTYVLESADPDVLLPKLLPFVMQTETFHEHSIKQSKGSVNPYINFSDLAWYEFALPPLTEQRRIAEVLWAVEEATEAVIQAKHRLRALRHSIEKQTYFRDEGADVHTLGSLVQRGTLTFQTGPFGTVLNASSYTENGYPVVNPSDMSEGKVLLENCRFIGKSDWQRLEKYQLKTDDMFIGRKGDMQNLVHVTPTIRGTCLGQL